MDHLTAQAPSRPAGAKWHRVWLDAYPCDVPSSIPYPQMPVSGLFDMSFLFSRRRRHTRWPRDWSSDVCSSDLWGDGDANARMLRYEAFAQAMDGNADFVAPLAQYGVGALTYAGRAFTIATGEPAGEESRSEERRVGKEGRSRAPPCGDRETSRA